MPSWVARRRLKYANILGVKRIYRIFEYSFVSKRIFVWSYINSSEYFSLFLEVHDTFVEVVTFQLYNWLLWAKLWLKALYITFVNGYRQHILTFPNQFWQMRGVNAYSSKRTNIRIFVRLEKGSFVTFRIFVSALKYIKYDVSALTWVKISDFLVFREVLIY